MAKKAKKAKKSVKKSVKKAAKKARRTTHRSASGKKLYAKRDKAGKFKDIQTFQRAHAADIKRDAKNEG